MKCQRCDTDDETVSTHSNVFECSGCWNYRKLDLPAAQHWHKVASAMLSNIDMHDMMTYLPTALQGTDVEYAPMFRGVQAIMQYSKRLIDDGPSHTWEK